MWQARQTLANNSSPLISKKLKPALSGGSDAGGPRLCAYAVNDDSESAAAIVMAKVLRWFGFPCIIWITSAESCLDDIVLRFDHTLVQPGDGVERRQEGSFLPCRNVRGVLARQHDPAVDLAEIVIVLRPRRFGPVASAAQCKGHAMPRNGDAVLEFRRVLRMNAGAEFDRPADPLGRRHRGEFVGVGTVEKICAEKHTFACAIEAAIWIGDLPNRQGGVADAAVDRLVLFPEAALELQADFDRCHIGHGVDGCFHAIADVDRKLTQNGKRN